MEPLEIRPDAQGIPVRGPRRLRSPAHVPATVWLYEPVMPFWLVKLRTSSSVRKFTVMLTVAETRVALSASVTVSPASMTVRPPVV